MIPVPLFDLKSWTNSRHGVQGLQIGGTSLVGGEPKANPFNPETPRWHLLKPGESQPPGQNMQQNQDLTNLTA
jgi:hypothetical protein